MPISYPCVFCKSETRLFEAGNSTPREFFSRGNAYTIAAAEAKRRLPIVVCTKCGHGFTPLDIPPHMIVEWYGNEEPDQTFLANEEARRTTAKRVLAKIASLGKKKGQLLDVGSGPGIFVSQATQQGWEATGLEPSGWAVQHGRESYGVHMLHNTFEHLQSLPVHSFDVVTLFDVIEHVPDPVGLLQAIVRVLHPDGMLIITTPRFDSLLARLMGKRWYCIFPAHVHYFTQSSLELALQAAGFRLTAQRTHTRYLGARYLWQRLKTFLIHAPGATITSHDDSIILPINLGDEFEVYARKQP